MQRSLSKSPRPYHRARSGKAGNGAYRVGRAAQAELGERPGVAANSARPS
jgi:hypothetical protein